MLFHHANFRSLKRKLQSLSKPFPLTLCKILAILGIILFCVYPFLFIPSLFPASELLSALHLRWAPSKPNPRSSSESPTNISHIVFGLVTGVNVWSFRKPYIDAWWRPNVTRGYLFLDHPPIEDFLPWPSTSPPYRVSDNISELERGHTAPFMVRMVHSILETFREGDEGVRWYVIGFDDSIFFVENFVDVLAKYDHTKYIYIGAPSEYLQSNLLFSFEMGFGGAGVALSYPLVAAMAKELKGCIKRYPNVSSADLITQYCVDEFGVPLTVEKGFHQIDLRGDISGFLSSHPQAPLLSLHHLDIVDPIFPSMDSFQAINHLMKAADFDQSRLLQQTIGYDKSKNWSFSISWGYSVHIYDKIHPRSILKRPLETFMPWWEDAEPLKYMFNTREPCESIPNVLFFESIEKISESHILTTYVRPSPLWKPSMCSTMIGNRSMDYISEVRVLSSTTKRKKVDRSECCDILGMDSVDVAELKLRTCKNNEIIA